MPIPKINPIELPGPWLQGWALDLHTVSSSYVAPGEFDTQRTDIGELVGRLKYAKQIDAFLPLVKCVVRFIREGGIDFDVMVSVPSTDGVWAPIMDVVESAADMLGATYDKYALTKISQTIAIKNVHVPENRETLLKNAFSSEPGKVAGKVVLLVDDIYRSGATLKAAEEELRKGGGAKSVRVLTLTKTRSNR